MPDADPDLFDQENHALRVAREIYNNNTGDETAYRNALGELISCYERLLRETRRLIRRSDREEFEMNQLNSRLNELASELEYRATHDSLTNTLNRGAVIVTANRILREKSLLLIVLDIDFFKQINDSFGHLIGDQVICGVVSAVAQCLPANGIIGRVGGEEFTVLLSDCDLDYACALAEQMRAAIANCHFPLPVARQITASFGVSYTAAGSDFSSAYGAADEALYKAKHSGRNCVICAN